MIETTSKRQLVHLPIRVECEVCPKDPERWDVLYAVNETDGEWLGDIGVDDFDAYSPCGFLLLEAVIKYYVENELFDKTADYDIDLKIMNGGTELGHIRSTIPGDFQLPE